ncbi:unnamed protein product [Meganyctiphanes norvegica]|uniref:Uncharacterized protein n=1 Tax=Meganyctiphanes norvegica TaxID=48144 RepID=A0AAV2QZR6_MEGNR
MRCTRSFLHRIKNVVRSYNVPRQMIMNIDQMMFHIILSRTDSMVPRDARKILFSGCINGSEHFTVLVPAGCTEFLQPLDADGGVNKALKDHLLVMSDEFKSQQRHVVTDAHG